NHLDGLATDLVQKLGFRVTGTTPAQTMVTGYLPVANIMALEGLANFASVTPVYRPIRRTGSVQTEGDAMMQADVFRAGLGVNGAGVKVGVLSDSVSQSKGGLTDSVKTGDLPSNVQVLQDGTTGDTDEGRAMLEIVHDVAPGSPLAFATADGGPQAFATNI